MSRILVDQVRSNSASGDAITLDGSGKCAINATTINNLTFPTSDGSANQLLKTDGSGALSFVNSAVGGKILQVATKKTTTSDSHSNASAGDYVVLTSDAITVSAGSTFLIFGNYHVWMQDNSNPFHGRRKIQREIGGNGSWSNVRGVAYSTFEYQLTSTTLNADSDLKPINAYDTHGQSAGTSIKYRIVHTSNAPSSCDSLTFQRGGNESNLLMMEVGS